MLTRTLCCPRSLQPLAPSNSRADRWAFKLVYTALQLFWQRRYSCIAWTRRRRTSASSWWDPTGTTPLALGWPLSTPGNLGRVPSVCMEGEPSHGVWESFVPGQSVKLDSGPALGPGGLLWGRTSAHWPRDLGVGSGSLVTWQSVKQVIGRHRQENVLLVKQYLVQWIKQEISCHPRGRGVGQPSTRHPRGGQNFSRYSLEDMLSGLAVPVQWIKQEVLSPLQGCYTFRRQNNTISYLAHAITIYRASRTGTLAFMICWTTLAWMDEIYPARTAIQKTLS